MPRIPADFSTARILISNDDGIHSQGIKTLEECISDMGAKTWVVAPEFEQSAAGHSLTIHTPLRIHKYDDNHVSVFGTPTDCTVMGIQHIMRDNPPDLLVSGINHGKNTGDDVTYSGTIAAAIEATILGCPAVAFSQHFGEERGNIDWDIARKHIPKVLLALAGMELSPQTLINVNIPRVSDEPKGMIVVPQGHYEVTKDDLMECIDPRGKSYFWIKPPPVVNYHGIADDSSALADGYITITPLSLNLTSWNMLDNLHTRIQS